MIAAYSTFLGISPNATMIREDVEAIAQMELTIARELNTPGEQRRNYHRQYNCGFFKKGMMPELIEWMDDKFVVRVWHLINAIISSLLAVRL